MISTNNFRVIKVNMSIPKINVPPKPGNSVKDKMQWTKVAPISFGCAVGHVVINSSLNYNNCDNRTNIILRRRNMIKFPALVKPHSSHNKLIKPNLTPIPNSNPYDIILPIGNLFKNYFKTNHDASTPIMIIAYLRQIPPNFHVLKKISKLPSIRQ